MERSVANKSMRARLRRRHKGVSAALAMLYLMLFSTLAIGFVAGTTMSSQVSRNERFLNKAQAAADGGMQFIRYSMGAMTIDPTVANPQLSDVATALDNELKGSANMNGGRVVVSPANTLPGYPQPTIFIPSPTAWISTDNTGASQFRAAIWQTGTGMRVKLVGAATNGGGSVVVQKAIQMDYFKAPKAGAILDYGIASKGTVATSGSSWIQGANGNLGRGSILSDAPDTGVAAVTIGGTGMTGDISVVGASNTISVSSGAKVGNTADPTQIPSHEHKPVPEPTFPAVDPSPFIAFATNPYVPGSTTLTNVYIPPNTNPKFTGGATINGVLYIKAPNVVTFKGNAIVNGVIVTDPSAAYDMVNNQINFGGTVTATPLGSLPTTNPAYDPNLVQLTGSFMLAQNFATSFTGNFGNVQGSIVASQINMTGNAQGNISGSLIVLNNNPMTVGGNATITITSQGTSQYPHGLNFGSDFTPTPGSYVEVLP